MLVLKRKPNEKIRIGSDIIVNIISVSEHQVKIGIEAPDDVKILREEIYETVRQNTIEASLLSQELAGEVKKLPIIKLKKGSE